MPDSNDWELKPDPKNANQGTKRGASVVKSSVQRNGAGRSIVAARDGTILAGNKTHAAAQELGKKLKVVHTTGDELVVVVRDDLPNADDPVARDLAYSDNRSSELGLKWDLPQIKADFDAGVDLSTHWNKHELDVLMEDFARLDARELEDFDDVDDILPGTVALKQGMTFPSDEPYGIPMLWHDLCAPLPDPLVTWAGPDASTDPEWPGWWLYNFGSDSIRGLDLERAIMAFYVDDYRFENWFTYPDRYVARMINANMGLAVTPNFSLVSGVPDALNIYNAYRARWLGRYIQESGLKVIPDVAWGEPSTFEYSFAGIPKYPPCICIQMQTFTTSREVGKQSDRAAFEYVLNEIAPESTIIYGAGREARMFVSSLLPDDFKVVWLASRAQVRADKVMSKGIDTRHKEEVN